MDEIKKAMIKMHLENDHGIPRAVLDIADDTQLTHLVFMHCAPVVRAASNCENN
jgi:hypothetical protein